jgi:hypothetical protein
VLDKFTAANKAKDANAVSRLLSKDCIIIMPEAIGVSARARFFTRHSYLELLKQRYSETTAVNSKRVIRNISSSDTGDVFVAMAYYNGSCRNVLLRSGCSARADSRA